MPLTPLGYGAMPTFEGKPLDIPLPSGHILQKR